MELGQYYNSNQKRFASVFDADWKVALGKCREHIIWKLKQKTLFGAHTGANLGTDPIDYYLELAYSKLVEGEWEWKNEYSLSEQMIRIVNSHTSKEVKRIKTKKAESFKIIYEDIESQFYEIEEDEAMDIEEMKVYEKNVQVIDEAVKGDINLEILWDALKEGKKRVEIAGLLDMQPKQFDKLKEKLIKKVKDFKSGSS
ncbi:MAG: hypothetical protein KF741_13210 [Ferruginibacter sp.]|nr:hypothetical protein [Bacteroidota bacterium]MBX2920196.1 hypothetical protein [Ferruginibacter sp.]